MIDSSRGIRAHQYVEAWWREVQEQKSRDPHLHAGTGNRETLEIGKAI